MSGSTSRTSTGIGWESPKHPTRHTGRRWLERLVLILLGVVVGASLANRLVTSGTSVTVHAAPLGGPVPIDSELLPWREATAAYAVTCENGSAVALNLRVDGLPLDLSYASMFVPAGGSQDDPVLAAERASTELIVGRGTAAEAQPASRSHDVPTGDLEVVMRFDEPPSNDSGLPALYARYQSPGSPSEFTPVYWLPPEWWDCDRRL